MNYKQIVHTWMFGEMDWKKVISHLRATGADGVDLSIHAEGINSPKSLLSSGLKGMLADAGLKVLASTPLYMQPYLDLASADKATRESAIAFTVQAADVVAQFGCDRMLVAPSWISVSHKLTLPYEEHWKYSVDSISKIAEYAGKQNIMVLIEPINRYRVSLVHTVDEALQEVKDIGLPNVHLVPDVFHMHMEEAEGVPKAICTAKEHLKCLHIGDNTRRCPGYGAIDWRSILAALDSIGFDGPLSYEPVQLYFDEKRVAAQEEYAAAFVTQLKYGITYLNSVMETLRAAGECSIRPL